jgi:hypothetical protein
MAPWRSSQLLIVYYDLLEFFLVPENINPVEPTGEPVIRSTQRDQTLIANRFYHYHIGA